MVRDQGLDAPKFSNRDMLISTLLGGKRLGDARKGAKNDAKLRNWAPSSASRPYSPIDRVRWEGVNAAVRSETGHEGVFFVNISASDSDPGGVLVVKTCADMAQQLFASTTLSWVPGLSSAPCRLLDMSSAEGSAAYRNLKRVSALAASKIRRRRYCLVMKFVSGILLKHLQESDFVRMRRTSSSDGGIGGNLLKRYCIHMGRLAAFDAMCYYDADRLPMITKTRGNGGNIIISPGNCRIIAIDNGVKMINSNSGVGLERANHYFSEVYRLVAELRAKSIQLPAKSKQLPAKSKQPHPSLQAVSKMIERYTKWNATPEFLLWMQEGFLLGTKTLVSAFEDTSRAERLVTLLDRVVPGVPGRSGISLGFLNTVRRAMEAALTGNKCPEVAHTDDTKASSVRGGGIAAGRSSPSSADAFRELNDYAMQKPAQVSAASVETKESGSSGGRET